MDTSVLAPLAVWDCGQPEWLRDREAKTAWLTERGFPVNAMYRAEFYATSDGPCARIFCYALNDNGKKHFNEHHVPGKPHDHDLCDAARDEPRDIPLDELPPMELR